MAKYCLFIDESGLPAPAYQIERPYILVGCAIDVKKREELNIKANELKNKYWGKSNVVFHHDELAKNKNDFEIFKYDPELKESFEKDLIKFLHRAPLNVFITVIDKQKIEPNWTQETIVRKTARSVFYDYIAYLYSRQSPKGEIVIEASNSEKDKYYLAAFSYFLSPAWKIKNSDFIELKNINEVISSISFTTKHNHDIETQIADIFGFAAYCLYLKKIKGKKFSKGTYKNDLIGALNDKLYKTNPGMAQEKLNFAKKVKGFQIIPK